jgi:hypothetical protein
MAIASPEALDKLGYDKWQKGLCHVFAEALSQHFGRGVFRAIFEYHGIKHVFLLVDGVEYDSETKGAPAGTIAPKWIRNPNDSWACPTVQTAASLKAIGGVSFGDDPNTDDLYCGREYARWLEEAKGILKDTYFIGGPIKRATTP